MPLGHECAIFGPITIGFTSVEYRTRIARVIPLRNDMTSFCASPHSLQVQITCSQPDEVDVFWNLDSKKHQSYFVCVWEGVGAPHVLRVLCHFKTRSRGGVIIYDKRIFCRLPTMKRRIQTFITHNQYTETYKTLSTGTLPSQDAFGKHDKTHSHLTRRQDYKTLWIGTLPSQDAFRKHNKTHSLKTRRQDLQDALNKHAPF